MCFQAIQPALFIAVYDVTEENSLTAVNEWIEFVKKMGGDINVPGVLIANKTDLNDLRVISPKAGMDLANSQGIQYLETSVVSTIHHKFPVIFASHEKILDAIQIERSRLFFFLADEI